MSIITASVNDGILTLSAGGRIDTTNADQVAQEIAEARAQYPHDAVILDVDDLEYISSAGLRAVLKLRKDEPTLKVINASSEVYEIFEMTGFSEMIPIEKGYRKLSVEGCSIIGKGAKGTVYRLNEDTIVKVYNNPDSLPDIHRERELARKAFILGVPTAISYDVVKVGDKYGSVFELLNAKSFSEMIAENPDKFEEYVKITADMLRNIHETPVKASDMPDVKILIKKWTDTVKDYIAPAEYDKLISLIDATPDVLTMQHGDYHTNNIMMQGDEALIIDMDTLSHGHPIFELANVYIAYVGFGLANPKQTEDFIGLPYAVTTEFWNRFLRIYLQTEDEARVNEVEKKVKLMAFVRLIRHTVRRGISNELEQKALDIARAGLTELLAEVDTLDF